jgi:FkbM family methyltransferase
MLSTQCNQTESHNIAIRKTRFRGFQLFFEHEEATDSMLRAIDDFPSFFTPTGASPLIIDCGANIGVSVLEWKYRWPMARVICFEPDPFAFELLQINVARNDLPGVECIEAALADFDGRAALHGDLGHGADARGNSLRPSWGRREDSEMIEVRCTRLAPYLAREPVAFLKIDIEGAEEVVLRDSSAALRSVDAAYVEVHETDELLDTNSLRDVERILRDAEFRIEIESRFGPHALPARLQRWQRRVGARQTQLLCWRNGDVHGEQPNDQHRSSEKETC